MKERALDDGASVAVVGASGFVGRRLVARLAAGGGLRPVAVSRRPAGLGVEERLCDATDAGALAAALEGVGGVVNCVAGDGETLVAATRTIVSACDGRRLVHLSSMAVYGGATGMVDEAHALAGGGGWYERAKVACEGVVAGVGNAVRLRPGCIHGPGSEQWTARIGRLLRQHRIGDLGAAGDGICNLIAVEDVVSAIVAALARPDAGGRAFNVGDARPESWNKYFTQFALAIGATPVRRLGGRMLGLEGNLLAPALKIAQLAARRVGRERLVPDPIPKSLLSLWGQEIELDHRAADAGLGFARTAPEVALAEAAGWFVGRGLGDQG